MKRILLLIPFILFLNGCGQTKYIYVKPTYPKIQVPREVPGLKVKIRNGCMWKDNHNTNLCGEDLQEILLLITNLRTNEKVLRQNVRSYHNFIERKSKQTEKVGRL